MAFDWKALLRNAAPIIATAIPGVGPLAGGAVKLLLDNLDPEGKVNRDDPKAVDAFMNKAVLDPASQVKILEAEQQFKLSMAALNLDSEEKMRQFIIAQEKIDADDRNSARDREKVLKDRTPSILAYAVTGGFFGILVYISSGKAQAAERVEQALLVMLGSLGTAWVQVVSYYFGSSHGSEQKNATIASAVKERK